MKKIDKLHPLPWSVKDPNGEFNLRNGGKYRPVSVVDAKGEQVAFIGSRGIGHRETADFIVACANRRT